ncbi:MAG TPA: DUF805 domain-containing protein [Rhizomicrobium sp.]|nr:DUF805 domain-containing protein [Rhizomicrobium sp.]
MRITDALLSPNGRLSRGGFWVGAFILAAFSSLAVLSLGAFSDWLSGAQWGGDNPYRTPLTDHALRPLWTVLILLVPVAWMVFCLLVKRWHDRGRSGWWLVVPLVGQVWAVIECLFLPGAASGNKYGPSPVGHGGVSHWDGDEIPEDMA